MKNFGLKTDLGRKLFFLCKIALENDHATTTFQNKKA